MVTAEFPGGELVGSVSLPGRPTNAEMNKHVTEIVEQEWRIQRRKRLRE